MKAKIIIGFIICHFLLSCSQKTHYIDRFTLKSSNESINIKIGSGSTNKSSCVQFLTSNDTNYLAVLSQKYSSIEIYNLNSRKLYKVVDMKKEGANAFPRIYGFTMKSLDTILAISASPQIVGIISTNGLVVKRIHYNKDFSGKPVKPSIAGLGCRPYINGDSIFLLPAISPAESSGILTSTAQKHTPVNIAISLKTGGIKSSSLKIPTELIDKDITGINACRVLGYNNCYIYSFSLVNGLFMTYDHLSFSKMHIETNYELKLKENLSKYSSRGFVEATKNYLSSDEVFNIYYDRYRECYYLVVFKRINKFDKKTDYRLKLSYPSFFIILLDKNLKHMGDVYFPDDTYSFKTMFISPKGLYISEDHINNPTFSEDYMRFRLFTLEKIKN
jgi:hypothetical protein